MNFKSAYVWRLGLLGAFFVVSGAPSVSARDAAFMEPGISSSGADEGAIRVEPKGDMDVGDTVLNVAKRTTVFFINQTNKPVQVEKVATNADGNVTAEITNDDCSKQGTIAPASRCTMEISVTPTSPGSWGVDTLMTHNGAGRIARVKLTGKTSGSTAATEKKETGLALSTKEVNPVNFGDIEAGSGKAVRSALMVNDSPEPITIYSIDVIEAGNGLTRLDQGCAIDMELKSGESCPVTLVWTPVDKGQISTDLIIRHSGKLGFAVIPIRGNAKGATVAAGDMTGKDKDKQTITINTKGNIPPPPSAADLASSVPAVAASTLSSTTTPLTPVVPNGTLRLIGTVGNRGVFLTADGTTVVSGTGEDFDSGDKKVKVINITAKTADVIVDGKKKTLSLGTAPELISKTSSHTSSSADLSNSPPSGAPMTSGISGGAAPLMAPSTAMPPSSSPAPLVASPQPPAGGMK